MPMTSTNVSIVGVGAGLLVGRNGGWVDDWSEWRLGNWLIRMEARLMIGRNGGWVDDLNWGQVVSWNYQLGSNVGLVVG